MSVVMGFLNSKRGSKCLGCLSCGGRAIPRVGLALEATIGLDCKGNHSLEGFQASMQARTRPTIQRHGGGGAALHSLAVAGKTNGWLGVGFIAGEGNFGMEGTNIYDILGRH